MPYPDEIIQALQQKHNLSQIQVLQLHNVLTVSEIRQVVENATLNPENFIIALEQPTKHVSILSPIAAKKIIVNLAVLEELRKVAANNFENWKKWEEIKADMETLNQIPVKKVHERKQLATSVSQKLLPLARFLLGNNILAEEYDELATIIPRYMNALIEPMQNAARDYFTGLFGEMGRRIIDFRFVPKRGGVQLGTTAIITYRENKSENPPLSHKITYYMKTHQFGSTSEVSSTKKVDPKEMFIYKVLEYMGYGPKVHFFFNPLAQGGFFIATQDVEFTKETDKTKTFTLFEKIKQDYGAKPASEEHKDARNNIICLDMLARIFRLTDTTTNPGNYGFVRVNDERSKWKIIDFRFPDQREYYLNEKILQGFIEGNTEFCYDYSQFIKYVLQNSEYKQEKFATAVQISHELLAGRSGKHRSKMPLFEAMQRAHDETVAYFKQHDQRLGITDFNDFEQYYAAVNQNIRILFAGVEQVYKRLEAEKQQASGEKTSTSFSPQLVLPSQ